LTIRKRRSTRSYAATNHHRESFWRRDRADRNPGSNHQDWGVAAASDREGFAHAKASRQVRSGVDDRGVHRARFAVLCPAAMPAVLIEGGFMSNPAESRRIYDSSYRRLMAKAIVDGVQNYKRQVMQ